VKVDIKWGPLGEVFMVTMGVAVTVVILVAAGMVGLAAKDAKSGSAVVDPKVGRFVGSICLAIVGAIALYGFTMIVAK
jgi:hypothetical protein